MRASPALSRLLAPLPVLQDLYVFGAPIARGREAIEAPSLSVVVIAFNEEECLASVVDELTRSLALAGISFELVLVDDGSSDGTLAIRSEERRVGKEGRAGGSPSQANEKTDGTA